MKLLTFFCLLIAGLSPARSAIILDSGQCVSGCQALPFGVNVAGHSFDGFGIAFTTSSSYDLTGISSTFAGFGSGIFSIYSLAGGLPDQPIFSQAFTVPSHSGFGQYSIAINTFLAPGSWALVATPGPGVVTLTGQVAPAGPNFTVFPSFAKIDGNWQSLPVAYAGRGLSFQLNGNAVPEPASWLMMIVGFALVGAAMRRRDPAGSGQTLVAA